MIINKVAKLKAFKESKNILFYLPIHGEVNLIPLYNSHNDLKNFILPKIKKNNQLDLHYINDLDHTEKGKYNILEPKKHLKKAKIKDIDLILVPGIAFDLEGNRIGYGKGYYDQLLKQTTALKIGIAYDFQLLKKITPEKHDIKMDRIITEKQNVKTAQKSL